MGHEGKFLTQNLSALSLGSETITPTFDEDVTEYTANITDATTSVTATADTDDATVEIFLNGTSVDSGTGSVTESVDWTLDTDILEIKVSYNSSVKTYKVTVTHTV